MKGRLDAQAVRTRELTIYHRLVWRDAERLAQQEHRAVIAEDLRRGCYLAATSLVPGWPKSALPVRSMKDLGNRTFSRVLVLWSLLIDDTDLQAIIKWENPDQSERESLVKSIERRAPDATIRAISANAFGTRDWESLTHLGQLQTLSRIISDKQKGWQRERAAQVRERGSEGVSEDADPHSHAPTLPHSQQPF